MTRPSNLLVLFTTGLLNEKATGREMEQLKEILSRAETTEQFCTAFELVDRNRITSNKKKIEKESKHYRLSAFRFLINRN
ncbi:MAG TPA: hypothetical protein VGO58_09885 [Chitinophagaceae bacterium]|jgi:hypothetical protein|nr:hypothetical protein [Chitinophagaceae bacterium]